MSSKPLKWWQVPIVAIGVAWILAVACLFMYIVLLGLWRLAFG